MTVQDPFGAWSMKHSGNCPDCGECQGCCIDKSSNPRHCWRWDEQEEIEQMRDEQDESDFSLMAESLENVKFQARCVGFIQDIAEGKWDVAVCAPQIRERAREILGDK